MSALLTEWIIWCVLLFFPTLTLIVCKCSPTCRVKSVMWLEHLYGVREFIQMWGIVKTDYKARAVIIHISVYISVYVQSTFSLHSVYVQCNKFRAHN